MITGSSATFPLQMTSLLSVTAPSRSHRPHFKPSCRASCLFNAGAGGDNEAHSPPRHWGRESVKRTQEGPLSARAGSFLKRLSEGGKRSLKLPRRRRADHGGHAQCFSLLRSCSRLPRSGSTSRSPAAPQSMRERSASCRWRPRCTSDAVLSSRLTPHAAEDFPGSAPHLSP